jgi:hypothetical protein
MFRSNISLIAALVLAAIVGGCAKAVVDISEKPELTLPKPDKIVVNDFAVTPDEVKLDKGIAATIYRDAQGRTLTENEKLAGKHLANKLSEKIVEGLNKDGIPAVRGKGSVWVPTPSTATLTGQFVTVDQGNQSERVWIGFGVGNDEVRTNCQVIQDGKLVAKGSTRTEGSLKPGMIVGLASGSAAGTVGASAAMGLAGAGLSETFLAGVDADATRTANEIVKKIHGYYVERGWLAK